MPCRRGPPRGRSGCSRRSALSWDRRAPCARKGSARAGPTGSSRPSPWSRCALSQWGYRSRRKLARRHIAEQGGLMYRLHCFATSGNCFKVAFLLRALRQPYETVFVDYFHGATRDPSWREEVNDMGEIPVLEDRKSVV